MKTKKILSLLLAVIMVMSTLTPTIVTAYDCAISVESIEVMEGTAEADLAISISGNPGFLYAKLAVVYKPAELSQNDVTSDLFESVGASNIRNNQVANYVPEGENASEYKGFFVEIENGDDVTDDGEIANLIFDLVAPEAGATYSIYVSVVEAFDANDDEVSLGEGFAEGSISYVADPNLGKYDEFTMFFAPEDIHAEVGETVNVDLRLDANPGLWSVRCMIVYPEALSVEVDGDGKALVANGNVFEDKALNVGLANLPLTDERLLPKYKEYFAAEGIATEGYSSVVLYYEPDDPFAVIDGSGVLASIPFNTDNAVEGESYEIKVYSIPGDIFRAESGMNFVDLFPATVSTTVSFGDVGGCSHENTTIETLAPTATAEGYEREICNDCGEIIYETILPPVGEAGEFTMYFEPNDLTVEAGDRANVDLHLAENPGLWSIRCMVVYPDELSLDEDSSGIAVVENGDIYSDSEMVVGRANVPLESDKCHVGYKEYFAAEGIETQGYSSTILYFEPEKYDEVVFGNGILASLSFKTENAASGESYDIKVYSIPGDIFRAESDGSFTDFFPTMLGTTVNVDGEAGCKHINTVVHTTPATCTEDGSRMTICTDCGSVISSQAINAPGHNYLQPGSTVIVPPTCTEGGYTQKTCQVCGDVAVMDHTEPDGHSFVGGKCEYCGESDGTAVIDGIYTESIEVMEGATTANPSIYIGNNPGFAYAKLVVVYAAAELAKSDAEASSDLFNTVYTGTERAGTHKDVKNYLPEGATGADYKGFVVELENLDDESGDYIDVTADGVIVNLPLDLVAPEVGDTYTFYVSVVEAFDANDDEVSLGEGFAEGSISYIADTNLGKYDDFTMFFAPETVTVDAGEEVTLDLRLDANPGLWGIRCMIVYPEELSIDATDTGIGIVENGTIYADNALNPGIANLPLTDDRLLIKYQEYFAAEGIATEGYNSVVLYYEPEAYDAVISGNGVLASLKFNTDGAYEGESYDIKVYYVTGDIFRAEPNLVFVDLFPATVGATVNIAGDPSACRHKNTYVETEDADCYNEGYIRTVCSSCGKIISTEIIPATSHYYEYAGMTYAPTCSEPGEAMWSCRYCGDTWFEVIDMLDHTPGEATCGEQLVCTECGEVLADALEHVPGDPVTVSATCTEDGSKTVSCIVCGEVISYEVITAPGHNYLQPGSTVIVPPTCVDGGWTQKTCQICGDVAIMDETDPDGHSYVDGVCEVCGAEQIEDGSIYTEAIRVIEGNSIATPHIYIENNPGIAYIQLAIVYKRSELTKSSIDAYSDIFDAVSVTNIRSNQIANYIPDGESASGYEGVYVSLENSNWENVHKNGNLVALPLELVAPAIDNTYSYYVTVVEACNEYEDEVYIEGELVEGTVTYCVDEYLGKYDEFTMFLTPEYYEAKYGDSFDMDLRLDANPGLWSIRCYVVYPEGLSLNGIDNGYVFPNASDLNVGLYDLPLDSDKQVQAFKNLIAEQGIATDGYCSTTIYFEPERFDDIISANGILANLHFSVNDKAHIGDTYDIQVYYAAGDIFSAEVVSSETIFTDYYPATVGATVTVVKGDDECTHSRTRTEGVDPTCTEDGYRYVFCRDCGEQIDYYYIPAHGHSYVDGYCEYCGDWEDDEFGLILSPDYLEVEAGNSFDIDLSFRANPGIWATRFYVVYPEELILEDAYNGYVYDSDEMILGVKNLPLDSDSQVHAFKQLIAEQGIATDGYHSTTFYFEPRYVEDVISGNGTLATLNFTLSDSAVNGGQYDIRIYYAAGDIFSADVDSLTFTDQFPITNVCTVNSINTECSHPEWWEERVDATCTEDGYIAWYCSYCSEEMAYEFIPAYGHSYVGGYCENCGEPDPFAHTHDIVHIEAVEAGCHYIGNIEYWYCRSCETFWQDEALTQITNSKNVIIPARGSYNVEHVRALAPTCETLGNIEYWHCYDCDQYWQDEALTQLTNRKNVVLGTLDHNIVHMDAVDATCYYNGNIEYWYCSVCGAVWADEALTQVTNHKNVIIPAKAHVTVILPAVAPTCYQMGLTQGSKCSVCNTIIVAQQPVAKLPHTMGDPVITPSTCTVNGTVKTSCIYCSYTETETLPLEKHNYVDDICTACGKADSDPSIIVSDAKCAAGKTFTVTVDLKNNPGIVSMYLNVNFDSEVFELVGVKDAGVLGANAHKPELSSPYTLTWVNDTATENYTVNGTIVTLTFKVREDAPVGEYKISVSYDNRNYDIFDKDLNTVDFDTVYGTVSVVDYIVGDVNGDGAVNKLDRVILTRYLANWDDYQEIDLMAADVNEDGEVNNLDRVILTRYLADWEEYPELPHVN